MTAKELFKGILSDKELMKKYNYDEKKIEYLELHLESNLDLVNVLKIIISGKENGTPQSSIYTQIKNYFKIA